MNLRKFLSVTLSVVLLCMAVPVGMTAMAEAYAVTDIDATTDASVLIADGDNLLALATGTCTYFDAYGKYSSATPSAIVHNGVIDGVNGSERRWSVNNRDGKKVWITYDLGDTCDITSLMVGGSASENKGIYGFDVYICDANAGTIQANSENYTPVYSTTDTIIYGRRIDLTTPAQGSKVVFCMTGTNTGSTNSPTQQVWITELAVAGVQTVLPYTEWDIAADTNTDKLIAAADNLLASAAGKCTYFDAYGKYSSATPSEIVHNGIIDGVNGSERRWSVNNRDGKEVWVSYDLGGTYDITSFMVGGSASENKGVYGFKVYVGDANAGTIQAKPDEYTPCFATTKTVIHGYRVDLNTPARGSKVVFCMTGANTGSANSPTQQVWITELAAAGTAVDVPYTVTDIKGTTNTDKIIAPADNILQSERGSCAYFGWSSADNKNMNITVVPPAHLQDGKLGGVGESTTDIWKPRDQNRNKLWVTYVLNGIYDVESFMVAGAGNTDLAEGCGIYDLKVYIGDVDAATIQANPNDYTPVYATDDDIIYGRRVDLKTPVRGTRVVLCMGDYPYGSWNDGQIWVTELAAAGTAVATDLVNLIAGKEPVDSYVADRGMPDRYNEERSGWLEDKIPDPSTVLNMTDGNYTTRHAFTCSCTTRLLDSDLRKYISVDTPWAVYVYHLGGTATVDQIVMTSTGEAGNYFLGGVDYYVGQTLKTLFNEENRVYTSHGEKTIKDENDELIYDPAYDIRSRVVSATLDTPRTGRYVALVVTRPHATDCLGYSQARIDEFEVFGTLSPENLEKFPQTTFTDAQSGCTMTLNPYNYDDVEIYERIGGLKVTKVACPDDMQYVSKDNWLMVVPADRYIYQLDLYDKQGNLLTEADYGTRTIDVSLPNKTGGMQILGTVGADNGLTRVLNSRTDDEMLIGESVVGRRLVRLTIDEGLVKWNGVTDVNTADTVAGTTARHTYTWLWILPVATLLLGAVWWTVRRRRVR